MLKWRLINDFFSIIILEYGYPTYISHMNTRADPHNDNCNALVRAKSLQVIDYFWKQLCSYMPYTSGLAYWSHIVKTDKMNHSGKQSITIDQNKSYLEEKCSKAHS